MSCNYNIAKTREALEKADAALAHISKSAWFMEANFGETVEVVEAGKAIRQSLSAPARPCDTMPWRDAWVKWRSEVHPATPVTYKECYDSTAAFMDWYMSAAESEVQS